MFKSRAVGAFAVMSIIAGGIAFPTPASAAAVVDQAAADRAYVGILARRDPRSLVRAVAWAAIAPADKNDIDPLVARFLVSDYPFAVRYSALSKARNRDFAERVRATHTAEFAPEVHAAADYALSHGDAALDTFARSGYAAAKQRDRQFREASGEQAAAIVGADRIFVQLLSTEDPGAQVRGAAVWALRSGATDADLVEFFAYGWSNAARLDLDTQRAALADKDTAWRATIKGLVADAQAAEQKALQAEGEAAVQLREAAARSWQNADGKTGPARVAWADAQQVAAEQAANWQAVVAAALAASGPNWSAVGAFATTTAADWVAEQQLAAEQAQFWIALHEQARAGEERMSTPAA